MHKVKYLITLAVLLTVFGQPGAAQQTTPSPTPDELTVVKTRLSRAEGRLADWPLLKRYAEANTKLPLPQKGEKRVVFFGDSITDGWDLTKAFPGQPYVNRGISGQTTPQLLIRFRPDVIALKPQVVVILVGTNDLSGNTGPTTAAAIENNYTSIAELAAANKIHLVFASVLPVNDYNRRANGEQIIVTKQRPPAQILELNVWLKDFCARNKCTYLDYFSALADAQGLLRADLANDGLHPNAKGYAIMAPLAEAAIKQALKSKR